MMDWFVEKVFIVFRNFLEPLAPAADSTFLSIHLCDSCLSCPWPAVKVFLLPFTLLFLLELSYMWMFPFTFHYVQFICISVTSN